jgi:hypothetical protein
VTLLTNARIFRESFFECRWKITPVTAAQTKYWCQLKNVSSVLSNRRKHTSYLIDANVITNFAFPLKRLQRFSFQALRHYEGTFDT